MYLLLGVVGYAFVILVLASSAHFGARVAARALGASPFRWFAADDSARNLAVRALSSLAALLAVMVALFVAYLSAGENVATLNVEVMPGPAQQAGIQSGDRILKVDGRPVATFDALRNEVARRAGEREIVLERQGRELTLRVTPKDGRIGVMPSYVRHSMPISTALARAVKAPWSLLGAYLERAFHSQGRSELMGPVGIVKSVSSQGSAGSTMLMVAMLAAVYWPLVMGVHVFDWLSGVLFRATHRWASGADATAAILARYHQALWIGLITALAYAALIVLQSTSFGDGAVIGLLLLAPAGMACVLLAALTLAQRSGAQLGLTALLGSVFIPCAALPIAIWALFWLRAELKRRGFEVRGLVANPRAVQL